ncbi:PepSY domain-containing protein [Algiphilus sp.]|uniref:PepSY domain-containing protein n=1 Tax=Algiphilus sp. TaxID=1872431 RepID=UPI003B52BFCC
MRASTAAAAKPVPARRNLSVFLRTWHKRAGLFAFAFMIWLGASGFLINQSAEWGYDTTRIDWPVITSLYGMRASPPREGFVAGDAWLARGGDDVFLNGTPIDYTVGDPVGMIASDASGQPLLYVATRESVLLLQQDGSVYDELSPPILPVREVRAIGTTGKGIVVQGAQDTLLSTDGGLRWTAVGDQEVQWSTASPLADSQRDVLAPYSMPSLPLERALLDLHSGQIFGDAGTWVVNIVGLMSIWLGISGLWMTLRLQRQQKRRAKA